MKVLAITTCYPSPIGQTRAPFNRSQLGALAQTHPVEVISPISWTEELGVRCRGGPRVPEGRAVALDGLTVRYPRYWYPPKVMRRQYGWFFRRSVRPLFDRALREFKPDVVMGLWAYPDGWTAVNLAHGAGLPAVVKVHGSDILHEGQGIAAVRGCYGGTLKALRGADAVVAVSRDLADNVVRLGVPQDRVHVVYNGLDATAFCPTPKHEARARVGIGDGDPVLVFAGRFMPVKRLEDLVAACARLARDGVPFRCYLVGNGPRRQALQEQVDAAGIGDRVKLLGARPQAELADWYRAADLFVLPSSSEGIPNVLLEASACGTPFVATRVGGVPEIASDPSRLVPACNPDALAAAIRTALADPAKAVVARPLMSTWEDSAESLARVLQAAREQYARTNPPPAARPHENHGDYATVTTMIEKTGPRER
jgi:glycosyltransferase involved in cell wall biosynthesis